MEEKSKILYLLSTCKSFSDSCFSAFIKNHEKTKTVATRHYFVLYITLCEPYNNKNYAIKDIDYKFTNKNNDTTTSVLDSYTNNIENEKNIIKKNILDKNIHLSSNQLTGIYTVASLIKYYRYNYKYLFIPIIIDYGNETYKFTHQAAMIIDFSGLCIFYEPYGKYSKDGKFYDESICSFFNIFNNCGLFNTDLKCITYHKLLKLDTGIQSIIETHNNRNYEEFCIIYDNLVVEILKTYHVYIKPVVKDIKDYTLPCVYLISSIFSINANNKYNEDVNYTQLLNRVLELYYKYGSKTCVGITLIEMNEFFKYSDDIPRKMQLFYTKFDIVYPNVKLGNEISKLVDTFKNSYYFYNTILKSNNIKQSCKDIFFN